MCSYLKFTSYVRVYLQKNAAITDKYTKAKCKILLAMQCTVIKKKLALVNDFVIRSLI